MLQEQHDKQERRRKESKAKYHSWLKEKEQQAISQKENARKNSRISQEHKHGKGKTQKENSSIGDNTHRENVRKSSHSRQKKSSVKHIYELESTKKIRTSKIK